jgi:hypothetical protein
MATQIHFVVYYDTEDKKFWLDDESLMSKFGTASWFDTDTQEWSAPEDGEQDQLDYIINRQLALMTQPEGTYFASDGSFGSADGLEIVDTSDWTQQDWEMIENASDSERAALARHIANVKVVCPQ